MSLSTLLADQATWYPFLFDTSDPVSFLRSLMFWVTIALVIGFVIALAVLPKAKRAGFLKGALYGAVIYACVVGLAFLVLTFIGDGIVLMLFAPICVLLVTIIGGAIALVCKPGKTTAIVAGCIAGAAAIATLVCMFIDFANGDAADRNWVTNDQVNTLGLYVSAILLTAVVIAVAFLADKGKKGFDNRAIAYAGVCVALSFALSFIRLVKMPQGGSITIASLLPLMLYAYMFGTKKGVFAGVAYGILQAFQDCYILHPAQFLLDYPLAFACIGLAGIFAQSKALKLPQLRFACGAVVAGLGRFVMHFLSGIFAFGMWAPEGTPVWLYSLTYQAAYVLPDIAIAIVVGVLLLSSKPVVKLVESR
ncbi:MAG: energy-coupled thiamine transporter ThiT [Christensenellaceae bacterium]